MLQPLVNLTDDNGTSLLPTDTDDDTTVLEPGLDYIGGWLKVSFKIALALIMAMPNFFLVSGIDKMLVFIVAVTVLPFLAFSGMCVPYIELSNFGESNLTLPNFADMMQNLFWNMNGFDSISTAAGEVR